MSQKRITASVKMRLLVEVAPTDTWGDDCSIAQIERQGREAAISVAQALSAKDPRVRLVEIPDSTSIVLHVDGAR